MRGGTSKGLFFREADLPADPAGRAAVFTGALGSPDPYGRQLNGMGGGISSLSKVMIVEASDRDDADLEYTFGQVAVDSAYVDYSANCGNLSSAVPCYAIEEGLVAPDDGVATIRMFNTNTQAIIHASLEVRGGLAYESGDLAIDGVAGCGAPVRLTFLSPAGSATGTVLPTGSPRDRLAVPGTDAVDVTIADIAIPVVFVRAESLGLTGRETPDTIEAIPGMLERLEQLRRSAAVRCGLQKSDGSFPLAIPKVALIAAPADFQALDGRPVMASMHDIAVRMISMGRVHRAVTVTGAMCISAAARIPGTVLDGIVRGEGGAVAVGHPSGTMLVDAEVDREAGAIRSTTVLRTARKLMDGEVVLAH